jgi:hypothetical protein
MLGGRGLSPLGGAIRVTGNARGSSLGPTDSRRVPREAAPSSAGKEAVSLRALPPLGLSHIAQSQKSGRTGVGSSCCRLTVPNLISCGVTWLRGSNASTPLCLRPSHCGLACLTHMRASCSMRWSRPSIIGGPAHRGGLVHHSDRGSGSWSPSATSPRPKPRNATTPCWNNLPWRRDSSVARTALPTSAAATRAELGPAAFIAVAARFSSCSSGAISTIFCENAVGG